jgi:SAM-dependent methyltransferase
MKLRPVAPTDSASYGAEDVPYTRNFFAFLAPAWLDHTALLAGVRPPAREPRLTWCDFGCGHGVTAALLAATHPAGMFYGVDLMPDHVDFARRLVDDADIPNAIFHTADFATIDLDLPRFDYIVAHGIYSWVGAAVRDALSKLIGRHLKSDGLVYVSCDAMPGCTLEVPCQRLLRELSATFAGNSVARLEAAARIVRAVAGAAAPAWANNRLVSSLDPRRYDYSAPEVVHSYMTTTWQPFFVAEMRAMMAAIGLVPAGSATLINNYDSYVLRRSEREVLATIADVDLRELACDFFLGTRFRTDVFARPDRAIGEDEQRRRLFDSVLALVLPAEEISYAVSTPAGCVAYDNDTARAIVAALASAPARLADVVANSALDPQDLLANALMLCAAGDARPVEPVQTSVADLNRMILRRLGTPEEIRHLALPFGTALEISDEDDPRAIGLLRHYLPDLAFAHPRTCGSSCLRSCAGAMG